MADDNRLLPLCLLVVSLSFLLFQQGHAAASIDLCVLTNYDVWNLTSKIWRFSVPKAACLDPKTSNTTDGCDITMAFCQPVHLMDSCSNSSVCETYTSTSDTYNLATYSPNSSPFRDSDGLWFSTNFEGGEKYTVNNTATCTLKTVMTFVCNKTAYWNSDSSAQVLSVPEQPSVEFTPGDDVCTYNITFDFAGACPIGTPGTVPQLSAGSILLMIFFVSVILYFVMGCFINIVRGKSGQELIPHHRFWAMLPVYIMDGMLFTTTCGERRSKQSYDSI